MTAPVDDFVPLLRLSTARRLSALRDVRDRLAVAGLEALRAEAARAIEADEATSELELEWTPARRTQHRPGARPLAAELTRALSALARVLGSVREAFGDSPRGRRAAWVERRLLPRGVGPLLRQPYRERAEDVQHCLRRLDDDPELRAAVAELGLTPLTDRLARALADFARTLEPPQDGLPFARVAAAREAGQRTLRRLVLALLVEEAQCEDAAQAEALRQALGAVQAQKAAAARLRKRRRARSASRAAREQPAPAHDGARPAEVAPAARRAPAARAAAPPAARRGVALAREVGAWSERSPPARGQPRSA